MAIASRNGARTESLGEYAYLKMSSSSTPGLSSELNNLSLKAESTNASYWDGVIGISVPAPTGLAIVEQWRGQETTHPRLLLEADAQSEQGRAAFVLTSATVHSFCFIRQSCRVETRVVQVSCVQDARITKVPLVW